MRPSLVHHCGLFAVSNHPEAARVVAAGLHALQHRGQEAAGISVSDGTTLRTKRGEGLVQEVFGKGPLIQGHAAIGHVRYSTVGGSGAELVQPLDDTLKGVGPVALAHNGTLINHEAVRRELASRGHTVTHDRGDTSVLFDLMHADDRREIVALLARALACVEGAWCILAMTAAGQLVAARDPRGFRPLVLGRLDRAWVVASETTALDFVGASYEGEIAPGEMYIFDSSEALSVVYPFQQIPRRACVFEHVYFARPDSILFGESVSNFRERSGVVLAQEHPVTADLVLPVPDSGIPAAIGYSRMSGIPFAMGMIRSHYVGRTFISPSDRDLGVRRKLAAVRAVVEGKRLIVIDDSIVRGTTSAQIVDMLRKAGAAEVHMRIASPPVIGPCHYGIDTPERQHLLAARLGDTTAMARHLGCDTLGFLSLAGLRSISGGGFCDACFSGDYPTAVSETSPRKP